MRRLCQLRRARVELRSSRSAKRTAGAPTAKAINGKAVEDSMAAARRPKRKTGLAVEPWAWGWKETIKANANIASSM